MAKKTGDHLRIVNLGENVLGLRLFGDRARPEPIHFRLLIPFGDVDVVRTTDGLYWVHTRINRPDDGWGPERAMGRFSRARLDSLDRSACDADLGDFRRETLYHVALQLAPDPMTYEEALARMQRFSRGSSAPAKPSAPSA